MLKPPRQKATPKDVRTMLYSTTSDRQDSPEETVLGRKSSSVLEQELAIAQKNCDKWRRVADKYYKEKRFLLRRLKIDKAQLLRELWSFQVLIQFMKIVRLPGFVACVLVLNLVLLSYIAVSMNQHKHGPVAVAAQENSLAHSLDKPYTIQVDSLQDIEQAKRVVVDLKRRGYQAYIGKVFQNDSDAYRVYVDEFASLNDVQKILKQLKKIPAYDRSFVRRKY